MSGNILIISTMQGMEQCAASISQETKTDVQVATTRRAGIAALRRTEYDVVVVEEGLAEGDPEWADQVWHNASMAMPLQLNFGISGCARLSREIRAALARRMADKNLARRAAAVDIANELKSPVTGLLLESELALRDPGVSPTLEPKLRHLVELAGSIRERLRADAEGLGARA
ncbi:hypothetical protein SAMN05421770_10355 [Granulicella rosea]|uniref:Response regulatory domain-containing protein n=1 Tax=Granulicella rosea TaxID=474952 RepID=A0A239ICG6_9BACT|nr:hypothetical protein [Granulicella rosea]SNS91466.1 hypothetical protein SAMN05421770_10355 [Granulicella rosea]